MKKPILICLAAITGILVAEPVLTKVPDPGPVSNPDRLAPARAVVTSQIVSRLQPTLPPFSRAMPVMRFPTFRKVELVDGEERLPFAVATTRKEGDVVGGYVRLSDNSIFIYRPDKKDYIPSTEHPRFAPEKTTETEPRKPA